MHFFTVQHKASYRSQLTDLMTTEQAIAYYRKFYRVCRVCHGNGTQLPTMQMHKAK